MAVIGMLCCLWLIWKGYVACSDDVLLQQFERAREERNRELLERFARQIVRGIKLLCKSWERWNG